MTIIYDSSDHLFMMFRCKGTVWPRILPVCVFSLISFVTLYSSVVNNNIDIALNFERTFAFSILASVFVALFVETQYQRFIENVRVFFQVNNALVNFAMMCVFLSEGSMDEASVMFRQKVLELMDKLFESMRRTIGDRLETLEIVNADDFMFSKSDPTTYIKELNDLLNDQKEFLGPKQFVIQKEMKLVKALDRIEERYEELTDFNLTPMPFPILNLCRVLVITYVLMVPLWFADKGYDITNPMCYFVIFFVVYSYLGMELVISDLDDPYGDDPTDIDAESILNRSQSDVTAILTEDTCKYYEIHCEFDVHDTIDTEKKDQEQNCLESVLLKNQKLYIQLGRAQIEAKNLDKANKFFREAIAKSTRITSATLAATELLGDTALMERNIELAISYYEEAMLLGLKHSYISRLFSKIGHGYFQLSKFDKALIYYVQQRKIEAQYSEPRHLEDFKRLCYRKSLIYLRAKKYKKAYTTLYDLLRLDKQMNAEENSYKNYCEKENRMTKEESGNSACLLLCLGFAHEGLGEFDLAIFRLNEALMVQRRSFGRESIEVLQTMIELAHLYEKNSEGEYAEEILGRVTRVKEQLIVTEGKIRGGIPWGCSWKKDFDQVFPGEIIIP